MKELQQLQSGDWDQVQSALEAARDRGDIRWVRPLLEAFRDASDEAIREAIGQVLGSLKVSEAGDVFQDALDDPEYAGVEPDIISFMWNTGLMPEEALLRVAEVGTSGDYRAALEALTWIEQLESVQNEHLLLEAILIVRGSIEDADKVEMKSLAEPMLEALHALERAQ
ncbi:MAG: HEAT repeat domain-containing protein [Flavobacteriales bacterium]